MYAQGRRASRESRSWTQKSQWMRKPDREKFTLRNTITVLLAVRLGGYRRDTVPESTPSCGAHSLEGDGGARGCRHRMFATGDGMALKVGQS